MTEYYVSNYISGNQTSYPILSYQPWVYRIEELSHIQSHTKEYNSSLMHSTSLMHQDRCAYTDVYKITFVGDNIIHRKTIN